MRGQSNVQIHFERLATPSYDWQEMTNRAAEPVVASTPETFLTPDSAEYQAYVQTPGSGPVGNLWGESLFYLDKLRLLPLPVTGCRFTSEFSH